MVAVRLSQQEEPHHRHGTVEIDNGRYICGLQPSHRVAAHSGGTARVSTGGRVVLLCTLRRQVGELTGVWTRWLQSVFRRVRAVRRGLAGRAVSACLVGDPVSLAGALGHCMV
jgi:hypothetical protein